MTLEKYKEICSYLSGVIENTRWEGHVFTVGGCIRDAVMGNEINDIDLAVTVADGGVKFAEWLHEKGLTYGEPVYFRRFSTSRFILRRFPDEEIEAVQTRREQYTNANSRNPEVVFGTLEEDCFRRDLTINSLVENVATGEIIDYTGHGLSDIEHHRIRTPLDADETFRDDPLRILRTIRFAVRYGWDIPKEIMEAMAANALRLKIIRKERLAAEFEKTLTGPHPEKAFELLKKIGAIPKLIPELCHTFRKKMTPGEENGKTIWAVTMERLKKSASDAPHRYAALFSEMHRISLPYPDLLEKEKKKIRRSQGRDAIVNISLRRLHYDARFIKRVKKLLPPMSKQQSPAAKKAGAKKQKSNK